MTGVTDTVAGGALPLAILIAALAGLVSFASPCVLPLVPGFLGYVTGLSDVEVADRRRSRLLLGALLFVLGFTAVYIPMAIFITSIGGALVEHRETLMRVGGLLVIAMALVFLGAGSRLGAQATRGLSWRPQAGLIGAPLLGAVFALGWVPCASPTLGAVLALSASAANPSPGGRPCSPPPTASAWVCRFSRRPRAWSASGCCPGGCEPTSAAFSSLAAHCSSSSASCSSQARGRPSTGGSKASSSAASRWRSDARRPHGPHHAC